MHADPVELERLDEGEQLPLFLFGQELRAVDQARGPFDLRGHASAGQAHGLPVPRLRCHNLPMSTTEPGPLRARPLTGPGPVSMPSEFDPRRLLRRTAQVAAAIGLLVLIVVLAPGLGEVRSKLEGADPAWIALAVAFEALSGVSYVLMFRPIFCRHMPWRTSWEIAWSELAMGSIVPASGAGGLALGAWILHEGGMPADRIARRSVAFFLIKSSVNFVAVAAFGTLIAIGVLGPHQSLWLTAVPAAAATLVIWAVLLVPRVGPGKGAPSDAGRVRKALSTVRRE